MSNVVVFENPLIVNGRFLGGFDIGVKLPKNPRKKVKVYELDLRNLHAFIDMLLGLTDDTLKRVLQYNSKWFTEIMAVTYDLVPKYVQIDIADLALSTPQTKTIWVLLNRKVIPTELPF